MRKNEPIAIPRWESRSPSKVTAPCDSARPPTCARRSTDAELVEAAICGQHSKLIGDRRFDQFNELVRIMRDALSAAGYEDACKVSAIAILDICFHMEGQRLSIPSVTGLKNAAERHAVCHSFDGRNYDQLAARLGTTPRTIRRIISRQRERRRANR